MIDIQLPSARSTSPTPARMTPPSPRKRLAFDEFLMIQLGMLQRKQAWQQSQQGLPMKAEERVLDGLLSIPPLRL